MRQALIIGSVLASLGVGTSALAQAQGGVGNHSGPMGTQGSTPMGAMAAAAPTVEDYIQYTREQIETARAARTISDSDADSDEAKLKQVESQLDQLSSQVTAIRNSLPN